MADVKLNDVESYESEHLHDSVDYSGDNGAVDADQMMEDPVCSINQFNPL